MKATSVFDGIRACFLVIALAGPLQAELVSVDIRKREPFAEGQSFGIIGPYEQIQGVMHFALDPAAPENQAIIDIEHAPANERGLVEFESDFLLVKPVDPCRANGAVLFNVANRGSLNWDRIFTRPDLTEASTEFVLKQGFTVLAIGWQHDVGKRDPNRAVVRIRVPVASLDGKPIRGMVAVSFTPSRKEAWHLLAERGHVPYKVADPEAAGTKLTVRDLNGREETVPRKKWHFGSKIDGRLTRKRTTVSIQGGFQPAGTYEVTYQSENPPVTGLGYAAVRDGVSAVEHGSIAELGLKPGAINRTIAVGLSQSGRFLRGFLYEGFNRDLNGERVFEGVLAFIAGAHRTTVNYRFAQPAANPGLFFPFTDVLQTDSETGETGGLLSDLPPKTIPKIMYLNTSNEYWRHKNAALVHTRVDGRGDVPLPESVRLYVVAGTQHAPAPRWRDRRGREQMRNPLYYFVLHRALLPAMDRWVLGQGNPPPSRYPRLDRNELVASQGFQFPKIPAVTVPPSGQLTARAEIGPSFRIDGPITIRPPRTGNNYPQFVCRVDEDGNEIAGIRLPELAVPLGTYTGWNQRYPGAQDMHASLGLDGALIPFARDKNERMKKADPRPSLAERYRDIEDFLGQTSMAALQCANEGYILNEDVASLLRLARFRYKNLYEAD